MARHPHLWLAIVLVVCGGLYLAAIHDRLFPSGDNATYILLSDGLLRDGKYHLSVRPDAPPHTQFPPGLPLLLTPIMALGGNSVVALKIWIALLAVVMLGLVYRLVCPLIGDVPALLLTLLTGLSPHISEYAHDVFSEIPFMLFMLAGLIAVQRYRQSDCWYARSGWWAGLWFSLAYLTRSIGLVVAAGAGLYLLLEGCSRSRWKLNVQKAITLGLIFSVTFGLWELRNRLVMPETTDVYRRAFLVKDWLNPELGNIGPLDFVQRVLSNISYYAFLIPERVLFFRYDKFLGSWSLQQLVNPWLWRGLILAGVVGGLIICLRQRRSAIEYTTGAYLAMLAIWHVADPRYLVPIIPFLLYYLITAISALFSRVAATAPRPHADGAFTRRTRLHEMTIAVLLVAGVSVAGNALATQLWDKSVLGFRHWLTLSGLSLGTIYALKFGKRVAPLRVIPFVLAALVAATALAGNIRRNIVAEHREPYYYNIDQSWGEYHDMALWIRDHLDTEDLVMCRKPYLLYLWSGRSVTDYYPFTTNQAAILEAIDAGVTHVVLDSFTWTKTTRQFLRPVIEKHPDRFEPVYQVGQTMLYRVRTRS